MRKLFFYFLFLIHINTIAQLNDELSEYYQLVNLAELNIVDNNINEAYLNYRKAFEIKKTPFGLDQYNFAVCCAMLKKEKESFKHVKYLIEYGYIKDSILNNRELDYLKKTKWEKKISNISVRSKTKFKISLDSLFIMDQKFRKIDKIKYKDTIFKIDSLNAISVINLKNKYDCFSETQIGLDLTPLRLIIMHNFQGLSKGKNLLSLYDLIYDCVQIGEIDVRIMAYYIQGYGVINIGDGIGCGIIRYGYSYFENGEKKKSELSRPGLANISIDDEININRKNIGLCSIGEYRKKIIFNFKNKSFKFTNSSDRSNMYFSTKEDYDKAIQNLIFLE